MKTVKAKRNEKLVCHAYTDGSFNAKTGVIGSGAELHIGDEVLELTLMEVSSKHAKSHQVSGEINAALMAIRKAIDLGASEITIHFDYEGVKNWPLRIWESKKALTKAYVEEYDRLSKMIDIKFDYVKAHNGTPGNEHADALAKMACGNN